MSAVLPVSLTVVQDDKRSQRVRLLGPAERSERRYLRNYDGLDDDTTHGGGGLGSGDGIGKEDARRFAATLL